jgi:hypothetical protein
MIRSSFIVAACVALGALASACASKGNEQEGASASEAGAMMCAKCETVWVREPKMIGPKNVTVYSSKASMSCPDCDAMAKSQLMEDGKVVLHACPMCKVTPVRVDRAPASHAKGTHQ